MIDTNLVKFLKDGGTSAGARVHTGNPPQKAPRPYLVVVRTGGAPRRTLGGRALFERANFTILSVGEESRDSLPLAKEVRDLLDNYRGDMAGPSDTTSIKSCRCVSGPTDVTVVDGDLKYAGHSQDFSIMFQDP